MHSEMGHSTLLGGMGSIFIHKHTVWLFVDFYRGPVWTFMESGCIALLVERENVYLHKPSTWLFVVLCTERGTVALFREENVFVNKPSA